MSNYYYADQGYGYADIELNEDNVVSFDKIQYLISLLKNEELKQQYSSLKTIKDFVNNQDLDYQEGQPIWELIADLVRQDTGINFEFAYDYEYNQHYKCIMIMDSPINLQTKKIELNEIENILAKYTEMITDKKFIFQYLTCIQYG